MNKAIRSIIGLVFIANTVYSQVSEDASKLAIVSSQIHKLSTSIFNLQYQYELAIANKQTLQFSAGLGSSLAYHNDLLYRSGLDLSVFPFMSIAYRNYYDLEKRLREGKNISNNSGNYFGAKVKLSTKGNLFNWGELGDAERPNSSFAVICGLQRNLGKHFAIDIYAGPQITNMTFKRKKDFLTSSISLSYNF